MAVIKLRELALMISGRDMPTCRMHILIRRHFEAERVNPRTCHCCNAEDTATRLQSKHSAHHTLGVVIRVQSRDFLWLGISAPIIHGSRASGRSLSDYRSWLSFSLHPLYWTMIDVFVVGHRAVNVHECLVKCSSAQVPRTPPHCSGSVQSEDSLSRGLWDGDLRSQRCAACHSW